jgi:hypothetical protein
MEDRKEIEVQYENKFDILQNREMCMRSLIINKNKSLSKYFSKDKDF